MGTQEELSIALNNELSAEKQRNTELQAAVDALTVRVTAIEAAPGGMVFPLTLAAKVAGFDATITFNEPVAPV